MHYTHSALIYNAPTQAAHDRVKSQAKLADMFREALATKSPDMETTYSDEAIINVYSTFTRKICNIYENTGIFVSYKATLGIKEKSGLHS